MILLTRYHSGERIAVNSDLIERIEETPDTVITLTNGTKHVVQQSIDEIIEKVQMAKATTLALANRMVEDPTSRPHDASACRARRRGPCARRPASQDPDASDL